VRVNNYRRCKIMANSANQRNNYDCIATSLSFSVCSIVSKFRFYSYINTKCLGTHIGQKTGCKYLFGPFAIGIYSHSKNFCEVSWFDKSEYVISTLKFGRIDPFTRTIETPKKHKSSIKPKSKEGKVSHTISFSI